MQLNLPLLDYWGNLNGLLYLIFILFVIFLLPPGVVVAAEAPCVVSSHQSLVNSLLHPFSNNLILRKP